MADPGFSLWVDECTSSPHWNHQRGKKSCEGQSADVTHSVRDNILDVAVVETEWDSLCIKRHMGVSDGWEGVEGK